MRLPTDRLGVGSKIFDRLRRRDESVGKSDLFSEVKGKPAEK